MYAYNILVEWKITTNVIYNNIYYKCIGTNIFRTWIDSDLGLRLNIFVEYWAYPVVDFDIILRFGSDGNV